MKKFEYKRVVTPSTYELKKLGLDGWELVCSCNYKLYFKREIKHESTRFKDRELFKSYFK